MKKEKAGQQAARPRGSASACARNRLRRTQGLRTVGPSLARLSWGALPARASRGGGRGSPGGPALLSMLFVLGRLNQHVLKMEQPQGGRNRGPSEAETLRGHSATFTAFSWRKRNTAHPETWWGSTNRANGQGPWRRRRVKPGLALAWAPGQTRPPGPSADSGPQRGPPCLGQRLPGPLLASIGSLHINARHICRHGGPSPLGP